MPSNEVPEVNPCKLCAWQKDFHLLAKGDVVGIFVPDYVYTSMMLLIAPLRHVERFSVWRREEIMATWLTCYAMQDYIEELGADCVRFTSNNSMWKISKSEWTIRHMHVNFLPCWGGKIIDIGNSGVRKQLSEGDVKASVATLTEHIGKRNLKDMLWRCERFNLSGD